MIASGHISESLDDQLAELTAIAATGVDGMVLVTNRLDARREGGAKFIDDLSWLLERLPKQIPSVSTNARHPIAVCSPTTN